MADVVDRVVNAEPSPPDSRDFPFIGNTAAGRPPLALAPSFRNGKLGPVLDQHATGTCGGQAGTGLRQWQEQREGHPVDKFSAFRLYDLCLEEDGGPPDPTRMRGTFARTVMSVLKNKGTPLDRSGFAGKIAEYERVIDPELAAIKEAIFTRGVVLVRCDWDAAWGERTLLPGRILPNPTGKNGGHIFLLFGWDDTVNRGSFLMRNSWGPWFPKPGASPTPKKAGPGNAYMRYEFFLDRKPEIWNSADVLRGPLP